MKKEAAVMDLLKKIYKKRFDSELKLDVDSLETAEGKGEFLAILKKMGCGKLNIVRFLVQTKYENMMSSMM